MRVIEDWNKMPGELVDVTSVNMFKNRLDKHWTDMGLQKAEQPIIYKYKYETILSWDPHYTAHLLLSIQ